MSHNFSWLINNIPGNKEEEKIIEKITRNQSQLLPASIFQEIQKNQKDQKGILQSSKNRKNTQSIGEFNYCLDGREIVIPKSVQYKKWLNIFDGNVAPTTFDGKEAYQLGIEQDGISARISNSVENL